MLHENRLLRLTQAQLDAQRKTAGLTPISTAKPTAVVARQTVQTVNPVLGSGVQTLKNDIQDVRMSAADANNALQVQTHQGQNIGTRPTAAIKDSGYTGAYTTLADAQKAQQEYYIKTGGSNPEIDAAVYNLQNRQMGVPTAPVPGPTGTAEAPKLDYASPYDTPTQPQAGETMQDRAAARGAARIQDTAQAQYILSTSRDPNARHSAQEFIDSQVGNVKGYVTKTVTQENGSTIQTLSEDENATAKAQEESKNRMALEQQNRLKSQEMADQHKKFVSTIDTTPIDQTTKQIADLMSRVSTLTPDLQAVILPGLLDLQNSNNEIAKQVNSMVSQQPSDAEIEKSYGTMEKYIIDQGEKYEAILEKDKQIKLDTADYNKESLEIEKKMIEHDAAVAEQKQIAMNVDNEKRLRRQLNRLGLQTDTSSLDYLQSEIQKGATALEDLKTSNNLVSLKAQLAIGKGYTLERDRALNDYEAKYLDITSQVTDKLSTIQNSISTAKKDRNEAIIEAKKWGLEQKQENDKEARTMLSGAYQSMMDARAEVEKTRQAEAKVELAYKRSQEDMDRREQVAYEKELRGEARAETRATVAQENFERKNEIADSKLVRSEFQKVAESQTVKDFSTLRSTQRKVADLVSDAKANPDDTGKTGAAITLGMTLTAKGSDPTTGVRDSELLKFGMAQSVLDKVWAAKKAFDGGDMSGISLDIVEKYSEAMSLLSESQRIEAQAEYVGAFNRLADFNIRSQYENLNPATISLPSGISIPDWAVSSYFADEESAENDSSWDVDWDNPSTWQSNTGTGEAISGSPYHKGVDEYALDIDGKIGDPIRSPVSGNVVNVVRGEKGLGNYVTIEDADGYQHTFGHMADIRVKIGDEMGPGITFGTIGNTGSVILGNGGDGSHLHYRVTKDGKAVNPKEMAKSSTKKNYA